MLPNSYYVKNRATVPAGGPDIQEDRCIHDPMYSILFFPERENLLLELIKLGIAIIHKRYSIVEKHRVFGLLETIADNDIRLYTALVWIYKERSFMKAIEDRYDHKGIFGVGDVNHFHSFVGMIGKFVDQTDQFHYDPTNIMEIVEKFVIAARVQYMVGPF